MFEQLNLTQVLERIETFTNIQPSSGVNNFVLEGPLQEGGTRTLVAAALFPAVAAHGDPWCVIASVNGEGREAMPKYHSKIARLKVSQRIMSFGIVDNEVIRGLITEGCRLNGLPIITISFAKYRDSGDDLILMNTIAGISPVTALREFQMKTRERLATLS